jgi:hypothetical protein
MVGVRKMRSVEPSEHQIQSAIVEWANNTVYPPLTIGKFLFAIPNGGSRRITEAVRFKKEGVKKGVSDLFFAVPMRQQNNSIRGGLWVEVKSKKGKVSKDQEDWLELMRNIGYCTAVVRGVDEGIQAIKDYLGMR